VISFAEAFWMGTAAGGSFFGKTGAFMPGYSFDALVIDDCRLSPYRPLDVLERLQRFIFVGDDRLIVSRYRKGELLPEPNCMVK
jgi:guanine deaminase